MTPVKDTSPVICQQTTVTEEAQWSLACFSAFQVEYYADRACATQQ